ncbi:MAG: hypothetical protein KQI81_09055 [Deltaproteobacteria bacterium]|nr:hypothetical protein [Deltaproteobacteria bacterium]
MKLISVNDKRKINIDSIIYHRKGNRKVENINGIRFSLIESEELIVSEALEKRCKDGPFIKIAGLTEPDLFVNKDFITEVQETSVMVQINFSKSLVQIRDVIAKAHAIVAFSEPVKQKIVETVPEPEPLPEPEPEPVAKTEKPKARTSKKKSE